MGTPNEEQRDPVPNSQEQRLREKGGFSTIRPGRRSLRVTEDIWARYREQGVRPPNNVRGLVEQSHRVSRAIYETTIRFVADQSGHPHETIGLFTMADDRAYSASVISGGNDVCIMLDELMPVFLGVACTSAVFAAFDLPDADINRPGERLPTDDIVSLSNALFADAVERILRKAPLPEWQTPDMEIRQVRLLEQSLSYAIWGDRLAHAMMTFVLCHELAHVTLGHASTPVDSARSRDEELDADAVGFGYFRDLMYSGTLPYDVSIPDLDRAAFAFFRLLDLLHAVEARIVGSPKTYTTHPPPDERRKHLLTLTNDDMSENGEESEEAIRQMSLLFWERSDTDAAFWHRLTDTQP